MAGRRRPARLPHRRRLTGRAAPGAADPRAALGAVCREHLVPHTATLVVRRRLAEDPELAAYARTAFDADAYRVYDAEAEHNRIRREQFDPACEEIARVQFEV